MAKLFKNKNQQKDSPKVDLNELKNLGITKDLNDHGDIEEIDGSELHGGKEDPASGDVCQVWPTTGEH